jgi:hypothetical protein
MPASTRVRQHLRQNIYGLIAIFIALSGTAYAVDGPLAGQNKVGSADIIDGEVYGQDLRANAVGTGKVLDGSLTGFDVQNDSLSGADIASQSVGFTELDFNAVGTGEVINDSLTGQDIANESVGFTELGPNSVGGSELAEPSVNSAQVFDDGLTGTDVNEATLSPLDAHDGFSSGCDPNSTTYVPCGSVQFTVGQPMEVIAFWTYGFKGTSDDDPPFGSCRTTLDGSDVSGDIVGAMEDVHDGPVGGTPVVDVIPLAAGTHTLGLRCHEVIPSDFDYVVEQVRIGVIELGFDVGTN